MKVCHSTGEKSGVGAYPVKVCHSIGEKSVVHPCGWKRTPVRGDLLTQGLAIDRKVCDPPALFMSMFAFLPLPLTVMTVFAVGYLG